jgi:hypothetical protein
MLQYCKFLWYGRKKLSYLQKDLFTCLLVDVMDVGVLSVDKMTGDGMISGLSYKNIMTVVTDNCKWSLYYNCVITLAFALVIVQLGS